MIFEVVFQLSRYAGRMAQLSEKPPITHAVLMRARESSGLLALLPTAPEAVARGVFWRDCGCAHPGVMAEDGAHWAVYLQLAANSYRLKTE